MSKSENKQAAAMLRDIESRVVWLASFLVNRGSSSGLNSNCAKAADEALAEYQQRFPAIQPPD